MKENEKETIKSFNDNIESQNEAIFEDLLNQNKDECLDYIENISNKIWNYRDKNNNSPLIISAKKNLIKILAKIIDVTKNNTSESEFISFINAKNKNEDTALLYSCYNGNLKMIKLLIENKADYILENKDGKNVISMAAISNKITPVYYFLIKYKMDEYHRDIYGNTYLHYACAYCSWKIVDFLLCYFKNYDVNIKNNKGETPLHYCTLFGRENHIKKLLLKGADISIKNDIGETPVDFAAKNKDKEIVKLFEKSEITRIKYINNKFVPIFFYLLHIVNPILLIFFILQYIKFFQIQLTLFILFLIFFYVMLFSFKLSDPGVMKKSRNELSLIELINKDIEIEDYCTACEIHKVKSIVHCYICEKCVDGFDHHCIWMRKCVGKKNINLFYNLILLIVVYWIICCYFCLSSEFNNNSLQKGRIYLLLSNFKIIKHLCTLFNVICLLVSINVIAPLLNNYYKEIKELKLRKINEINLIDFDQSQNLLDKNEKLNNGGEDQENQINYDFREDDENERLIDKK